MIRLENLTKTFDVSGKEPIIAANNVSMEVGDGEICVLLGPSGCGKTTTLKMINGLIPKTSGKIYINDVDTDTVDPILLRRDIGYVIQQIGLFPNLTIEENICVVPDLLKWDKTKSHKRAVALLEKVNLDPEVFLKRYPYELSGGQQQRVGVIRALAADPPIVLMDEPFSAIDPINRETIQDEFLKMNQELKKTVLFVSHDIDEAIKMADKVAIFRNGILEQCDKPETILSRPANSFVKTFVGNDRTLKRLKLLSVAQALAEYRHSVRADEEIAKAIEKLREHDVPALVVTNSKKQPRSYLDQIISEAVEGSVSEYALPIPGVVHLHDKLHTAVSSMYAAASEWLPVVDDEGKYQGYITQHSITALLGEQNQRSEV